MTSSFGKLLPDKDLLPDTLLSLGRIRTHRNTNTHRFREYFIQLKLAWVHPTWCSELSLEKTHQRIKRTTSESNNIEHRIMAMKSILFTDWQERLESCWLQPDNNVDYRYASFIMGGISQSLESAEDVPLEVRKIIERILSVDGPVRRELVLQQSSFMEKIYSDYCVPRLKPSGLLPISFLGNTQNHRTWNSFLIEYNAFHGGSSELFCLERIVQGCSCKKILLGLRLGISSLTKTQQ